MRDHILIFYTSSMMSIAKSGAVSADDEPMLRSTEVPSASFPCRRIIVALFGFFLLYSVIASCVIKRFPNSGDEYSYLLQAKIFSTGRLSIPSVPTEIREFFRLDHVIDDGRVRSKYPPGWPLLLSFVEPAGLSWCLNPLLGSLTLYFLFRLAVLLLNRRAAWVALVTTGSCPFFIYICTSYFSHTSALLFMALSLYAFTEGLNRRQAWRCFIAGLAAGFTFCIRPLDGVVCAATLALVAIQRIEWKTSAAVVAGLIPMVAGYLVYNHAQFGGAFTSGYDVYRPLGAQLVGGSTMEPEFSWVNVRMYRAHFEWLLRFAKGIIPGTILIVPVGAYALYRVGHPVAKRTLFLFGGMLVILFLSMQFIVPGGAGDAYGPRYLFPGLLPVAFFIAAGATLLWEKSGSTARRGLIVAACLAMLLNGIAVVFNGHLIREKIIERSRVYTLVATRGLKRVVIFLRDTDDFQPQWYTRNGINYGGDVVYVFDLGLRNNERLRAYYPGYRFYQYRTGDHAILAKTLVPYHFSD
jgi:hypothetical protein